MDNTTKIRQTVTDSIFEVFEKMFYIFLEPDDKDAGIYHWRSSINFSGAVHGEMAVLFSQPLAEAMVRNMLNAEWDEMEENLRGDCLKEAINMICGNFLRKVDPTLVFDLSIPAISSVSAADQPPSAFSSPSVLRLNFKAGDGEWLAMIMKKT